MTSILKVDTIQTAAGGTPTAADLGLNVSGTPVQIKNFKLTASGVTTAVNTWIEASSGNRPVITPKLSNSSILVQAGVAVWGDVDNDGHGYVSARVEIQRHINGVYIDSLFDDTNLIDRGGQSRLRRVSVVDLDTNVTQGQAVEYQVWVRLVTTTGGRSLQVNTVNHSSVILTEIAG